MAVVLKDLGVCYFPAPKVANTSIKHLMYEVEHGHSFVGEKDEVTGAVRHIHKEFSTPLFKELDLSEYDPFLRFAVIRDPVERMLSAWRNRVVHHGELSEGKVSVEKLTEAGVTENPDLETFIDNLDVYRQVKGSIHTHTAPLVDFLGKDSTYYHLIFTMENSHLIEELFYVMTGVRRSMGRSQTGGPKVSTQDLDAGRIQKIKEFYAEDYEVFGHLLGSDGAGVPHGNYKARTSPSPKSPPKAPKQSEKKSEKAKFRPMDVVAGYLPIIKENTPEIQCPACGQKNCHVQVQYPSRVDKWAALRVMICENCGLGFVPEIPFDLDAYRRQKSQRVQKRAATVPPEQYFAAIDRDQSRIARRARTHASLLKKWAGNIGNFLEINPRSGALYHYVTSASKWAADVNEACAPHLDHLGVKRTTRMSLPQGTYDVVMVSHLLQEMPIDQVPGFLDKCRDLLTPDGLLLVEVPEWGSLHNRVPPKHGGYEPHTNFFSPQALVGFLEKAGLKIHYLQTRDKMFPVSPDGNADFEQCTDRNAKDATHLLAIVSINSSSSKT
tara:strand:- start:17870 stop:19528 length:1659 start_codon:yes stop_codon:yes gene_type:complete